jgi:hypothetical protein
MKPAALGCTASCMTAATSGPKLIMGAIGTCGFFSLGVSRREYVISRVHGHEGDKNREHDEGRSAATMGLFWSLQSDNCITRYTDFENSDPEREPRPASLTEEKSFELYACTPTQYHMPRQQGCLAKSTVANSHL